MSKLSKIVDIIELPSCSRALLKWRPRSVASYDLVFQLQRENLDFRTIIDAGANVGQFARAAAELFKNSRVLSIEPVAAVADVLRRNLRDCGRVEVIQCAVGDEDGTVNFYENEFSQMSSALRSSGVDLGTVRPVSIARLDTLLADRELPRPMLLKLDLQGYELRALKGAAHLLSRCDRIIVETAFYCRDYQDQPLFEDVQSYLALHGFRLIRPLAFLRDSDRSIFQMDALFGPR